MDRDLIKAVVGLTVSAGVGVIVKNAVIHTSAPGMSKVDKVLVGIGSFAIGGMLSNHAIKYSDGQVDFIFNTVDNIKINRNNGEATITIDPSDVS